MLDVTSLFVLGILNIFLLWQQRNTFLITSRRFFIGSLISIGGVYVVLTLFQYWSWYSGGEPYIFFLPPFESIWYVIHYHLLRFLLPYLIALLISLGLLIGMRSINKHAGGRVFYAAEAYLVATSVFLFGYSQWNFLWIHYLIALAVIAVIGTCVQRVRKGSSAYFSLYYWWLPTALSVILIHELLL